jgi:aromatic ring hydroxylase
MTKDEALKLALHGLEMGVTLIEDFGSKEQLNTQHKAIAAIYEALAQPEQEPYCYTYTENGEEYFAPPTAYVPDNATPLYTTPPQRTWVNLTSEEIGEIYRVGWANNMELARAIEAKLKEKNT